MKDDDIDCVEEFWELAREKLIGKIPVDAINTIERFIYFHLDLYNDQED